MSLTGGLFNSGLFKGRLFNGGLFKNIYEWSPASLFSAGEQGAWYDPSDLSTLFQDAAGTTPVTATGQSVRMMLDKSGNGNHAIAPSDATRPVLQQDANGKYYLDFDGVDDRMLSGNIDASAHSQVLQSTGFNFSAGLTNAYLWTTGNGTLGSIAGTINLYFSSATPKSLVRGTVAATYTGYVPTGSCTAGNNYITTSRHDLLGAGYPEITPYKKIDPDYPFTWSTTGSATQGGVFGNQPIILGRSHSVWYKGRLYQVVLRFGVSTDADADMLRAYVAGKTGVTLS